MSNDVDELLTVIASVLKVDRGQLNRETKSEDIPEWDSLAQLNVCMAVQEKFGVEFDLYSIVEASSVLALHRLVQRERKGA